MLCQLLGLTEPSGACMVTLMANSPTVLNGIRTQLSPREREVVALVSLGDGNPEIAEKLVISVKTVEGHIANAVMATGSRNRVDLAVKWALGQL